MTTLDAVVVEPKVWSDGGTNMRIVKIVKRKIEKCMQDIHRSPFSSEGHA